MKLKRRIMVAVCSMSLLAVTAMPALAAKPTAYIDDTNGSCPRGYTKVDASNYENADLNDNGYICVK